MTEYEYYLEQRYRVLKKSRYDLTTRKTMWEDLPDPQWTNWHDASGYNKEGSVYRKLSFVKGVLTRKRQNYSSRNNAIEYEFRLYRRPVMTPPPWELCDDLP